MTVCELLPFTKRQLSEITQTALFPFIAFTLKILYNIYFDLSRVFKNFQKINFIRLRQDAFRNIIDNNIEFMI